MPCDCTRCCCRRRWPGLAVAAVVGAFRWRRVDVALDPAEPTAALPTLVPWTLGLGVRAAVPLLPIVALLLAHAGAPGLRWLLALPPGDDWRPFAGALPVVRALLLGVVVAAATAWRRLPQLVDALFVGMGRAYGNVIALTICAQVFGAGLAATGAAAALLAASQELGALPLLSVLGPRRVWRRPAARARGPILAFAQAFLGPLPAGPELDRCAALTCLAGAFGRTLSPVAAVTVCVAGQLRISPVAILRQVAGPTGDRRPGGDRPRARAQRRVTARAPSLQCSPRWPRNNHPACCAPIPPIWSGSPPRSPRGPRCCGLAGWSRSRPRPSTASVRTHAMRRRCAASTRRRGGRRSTR